MAGMPDKFPARRDRWRHRSWHTRGTRSHRESNGGGQCTAPRRGGNREHLQPNRDSISDRTRPGPRTKPDDIRRAGGQFLGVGLLRTWIVLQRIASGCRWRDPLSIRLVLRHLPADDITDQDSARRRHTQGQILQSPPQLWGRRLGHSCLRLCAAPESHRRDRRQPEWGLVLSRVPQPARLHAACRRQWAGDLDEIDGTKWQWGAPHRYRDLLPLWVDAECVGPESRYSDNPQHQDSDLCSTGQLRMRFLKRNQHCPSTVTGTGPSRC